jgi:hypothetical protein
MALLSGVEVSGRDLRVNRSRSAIVVAAVVLVLPLGACSEDPKPKFAPPESSSPAATSESTSAEPSPSNPVGTVRAWVEAQNDAMRTGDSSEVRSLSARPCQACDGMIDPIDRVYEAGGYFMTAGWRIHRIKARKVAEKRATVDSAVVIAGGKTVNAAGAKPVRYGVDRKIMVFKLTKPQGTWLVSFIGFLS